MKWAFVRHGRTEWNKKRLLQGRTDNPLSAEGYFESTKAAQTLQRMGHWHAIYSSPLMRSVQTAQRAAEILDIVRVHAVENLVERDFGPAEGVHLGDFDEETLTELMCAKESDEEVQQRALHAFRYIAERHRSHNVILVGHGALFRLGLSAALGYDHPPILNGDICEYPAERFREL
ncbi:histidine phosphatase family protein [Yaniella halotolerans]|uniref:histidine phosphatase family protein n=1 Tax=Yaniella halotolerans TaxID=225453 RepID=UPI0003B3257F|nr:histidine phosphatase family protein [Yaniella halotolerans]